jgi:putative transcriptional regulator
VKVPFLILLATLFLSIWHLPVEDENLDTLTGSFLIASNQIEDLGFAKTVIYIVKHDKRGAMGIIINRPQDKVSFAKISEIMGWEELSANEAQVDVFYGGPVEFRRSFFLHSSDVLLETSSIVDQGVAFTTDPDLLKSIAQGKGPQNYIFALGYAGWVSSQLEAEIARGAWLTQKGDLISLFSNDPEKMWELLIGERIFRL